MELSNVIHAVPGWDAFEVKMVLELEILQRFVEGHIETVTLDNDVVIICNEEGKIRDMEPNFIVDYGHGYADWICGPAIICGKQGSEFTDIPKDKVNRILKDINERNEVRLGL